MGPSPWRKRPLLAPSGLAADSDSACRVRCKPYSHMWATTLGVGNDAATRPPTADPTAPSVALKLPAHAQTTRALEAGAL